MLAGVVMKVFAIALSITWALNSGTALAADAFVQQASSSRSVQIARVQQATNSRSSAAQARDEVAATVDALSQYGGRKAGTVIAQQIGTNNRVDLTQDGEAHLAMIVQNGSSNVLIGQQSGSSHMLRAEQSGTGNEIRVAQFGQGQSAVAIQNGSGNQIHIVQR